MTQVVLKNLNTMLLYRERIFAILVAALILSSCAYVFLLQKAIMNVVAREKVSKEIRHISTSVSELESKYLSAKNTINIELAHARGFKNTEVSTFISKKSLTAMADSHEL
ncbi:MAG: hypothetical protein V4697_01655 [Patescibacteria group bacterium]